MIRSLLIRSLLTVLSAVCLLYANAASADQWPQFRGSNSDGVAGSPIPIRWNQAQNVRWKINVEGEGWSCPIVWDDLVFVTTAVNQDQASAPAPYEGGGGQQRADLQQQTYHWDLLCLDAATGRQRWRKTAHKGSPGFPRHSSNTYATETPLTDGERVYAYFGMVGLFCFDLDGNPLWQKDFGVQKMRAGWGTSSSPVLFEGRLFVQVDNEDQSFLVALDAVTGTELWRTDRGESSQYSSPIIWQNSQRNELIVGGMVYRSYEPATGKLLWQLDMLKGRSSATPIATSERLYVGTELRNRGGDDDGGGYLFSIRPGGSGDISLPADQDSSDVIEWRTERCGIQMSSPVLCQGHLYLPERRSGILHCIDATTGKAVFQQRLPRSKPIWASTWTDGRLVFCLDEAGTTHVLQGGPELVVVEQNQLDEQTWSSPAVAGGAIYLRTAGHLYCIAE